MPTPQWVALGFVLVGKVISTPVFRGDCELIKTLGSLSDDGAAPSWFFGLSHPNNGACGLLGSARSPCQNGDLQKHLC